MTAPTKMALVPVEATFEMIKAARAETKWGRGDWGDQQPNQAMWSAALAASPSSGRVPAADLERAAEARYACVRKDLDGWPEWRNLSTVTRHLQIEQQRAAFAAIGLPVEGEQG